MHQISRLAVAGLVLLAPVGGRPSGRCEVALEVDGDDRVPLLLGHVDDHPVAQDAGVVDEDVEIAERLDRAVDQALRTLPVGDVVAVDDRFAADGFDLVDNLLRRRDVGAGAVVGAAEVVDDDAGAFAGEEQRMLSSDSTACAGDDCNSAVKRSHAILLQTKAR